MRFRPSLIATIGLAGLCALFLTLGHWQSTRAVEKEQRISAFEAAAKLEARLPPAATAEEFTRVSLQGSFDQVKHILVDNQVLHGRVGVHVYTPFNEINGRTVLVNRGWLPLGSDRRQLPDVRTSAQQVSISGHIGPLPSPGRQLGETDVMNSEQWPQLVTYPDLDQIGQALDTRLYPMALFLEPGNPEGFEGRDWKPVYMTPGRHRAYAFQWFALAAACMVTWVVLAIHGGRSR